MLHKVLVSYRVIDAQSRSRLAAAHLCTAPIACSSATAASSAACCCTSQPQAIATGCVCSCCRMLSAAAVMSAAATARVSLPALLCKGWPLAGSGACTPVCSHVTLTNLRSCVHAPYRRFVVEGVCEGGCLPLSLCILIYSLYLRDSLVAAACHNRPFCLVRKLDQRI